MSRYQMAGQKHILKIDNRSSVEKFRHLVTTLTDQKYMHEGLKAD
jgi:hypothetical protein